MFLVNSRLGRFTAAHFCEHSFSLSYGVILQSSLAIVLSLTLGFSPHPCVSIFGTGCPQSFARSFSWEPASPSSVLASAFHTLHAFGFCHAHLTAWPLPRLPQLFHPLVRLAFSVTPSPCVQVRDSLPVVHRLRPSASP